MGAMKAYLMEMEELAHNLILEKPIKNFSSPEFEEMKSIFLQRYPNNGHVFDSVFLDMAS